MAVRAREPELLGQTVVVIGGSAGIGLETARRAQTEGAEVVLIGRDPGRLERAAAEIGTQRTEVFDATDPTAAVPMDPFFRTVFDVLLRAPARRP
ncbi:SDR family NAD(P)-dependent oxidoreductase [Streptomyces sp. NPDC127036]|uniref:SDR family NAD(P)-dependent oxidoreductase n=1 Tax=Streptomyces sp. NPDC127036 TaxID=3347112 RepID=UPI003657AD8C